MHHRKRLAVLSLLASIGLGAPAATAASAAVTISPLPGTPTALARTQISFLGAKTLGSITVVGSSSGRHRGRVRFYSSAVGASFLPSTPFTPGERVTVRARVTSAAGKRVSISSSFTIAQPGVVAEKAFQITPGTTADVQSFRSQPQLHPPVVTVHQAAGPGSAHGYIFASPFVGPGQYGPMIFDNAGNLVWFRQTGPGEDAADFQTQTYLGESDLTWWQGRTIQYGYGMGVGVIADASYHTVATVRAGNGLQADEHEFLVTPQGTAYLLAYSPVVTSLLAGGGPASGVALDGVIQEIDIRTGLVMWEWHSLGHVDMSESFSRVPTAAGAPFDYFHINSLTTDRHGNLLISARNTWALYDISARTGAVMWRLGGTKSTFALGAGVQFADQHNALWLPNGEISLFDDEGAPPVKPPSRGELIKLDLKAKTATLAGQLVRSPAPLSTASQGNLQSLPGGGWMIGWGGLPNFTEFNAQGQVIYDAQLPGAEFSYRVYRESWSGQPDEPPALVAVTSGATTGVYASWNGATTVASWQLLTGSSSAHMTAVSTTPKSGFETVIPASPAAFYEVRALGASGKILGTSAAVAPTPG